MSQQDQSITLYSTKDGADKVYRVALEAKDGGFTVTGWNGRRGGSLKAQPKTLAPLPHADALKAYNDLVKSKMKGGYHPGDDGSAYEAVVDVGTRTGIELHLLTAAPESDIERYLTDDAYMAQPKLDGERRPVARRESVMGSNRNGFQVPMPKVLVELLGKLPQNTEIDAEQVGDTLFVFDAMKIGGTDIRALGAWQRMQKAEKLIDLLTSQASVLAVSTAIGTEAKRGLYTSLRANRQEGIVFKRIFSEYGVGRNDDQIKIKFVERATLQVFSVHPVKRSIAVQAFGQNGIAVPLGNVTIPADRFIPAVGELCEIEYLYTVKSLVQPVYKGVRTDLTLDACTTSQLKYRAGVGEDDAQDVECSRNGHWAGASVVEV